jgi:hypothetical protein
MLLFVTEAWAVRKDDAKNLALTLDGALARSVGLLREIYDYLEPEKAIEQATNGQPAKPGLGEPGRGREANTGPSSNGVKATRSDPAQQPSAPNRSGA